MIGSQKLDEDDDLHDNVCNALHVYLISRFATARLTREIIQEAIYYISNTFTDQVDIFII